MKTKGLKGLKIINRKPQNKNTSIHYFKYKLAETVPCVGNWDQFDHSKYMIAVPRKFYMTMDEFNKKEVRRKHYKNKIKSIQAKIL